jgi:hypothetical protein
MTFTPYYFVSSLHLKCQLCTTSQILLRFMADNFQVVPHWVKNKSPVVVGVRQFPDPWLAVILTASLERSGMERIHKLAI